MFESKPLFTSRSSFKSVDGFQSNAGDVPPPVDDVTFRFPLLGDAGDTKSSDVFTQARASAQTEIFNNNLVTYQANEPAFSDYGLTTRRTDTNRHGYSADVTQLQPTGAFTPDWNYGVGQSEGGVTTSYDGVKGTVLQDSSTGEHKIAMAKVRGLDLDPSGDSFVVMIELKPVGGQKFVMLRTNLNDDIMVNLDDGTFTGAVLGGYTQLLDDGKVFIYHVADITGNNAPQAERIFLLDDNENVSFTGDPTKGVEITSAAYASRFRPNQYCPIINNTGADLTMVDSTNVTASLSKVTTDRDFTFYCEITNTLFPTIANNEVFPLLVYHNNPLSGGWGLALSRSNTGQALLVITNLNQQTQKIISEWPQLETRRVSFQILDGLPAVLDVDEAIGDGVQETVTIYPQNLSAISYSYILAENPFFAVRAVKRIEKTGLTLTQAQNEQ